MTITQCSKLKNNFIIVLEVVNVLHSLLLVPFHFYMAHRTFVDLQHGLFKAFSVKPPFVPLLMVATLPQSTFGAQWRTFVKPTFSETSIPASSFFASFVRS